MNTRELFQTDADLLRFTERVSKIFGHTPPEMQKTNKHHTVKARRRPSEDAT